MKRFLCFFVIIVMLTACNRNSIITDPEAVEKLNNPQTRTIEFWHTYSDEETHLLEQELIPAFEKQNPGIRVHPVRHANNIELKYTLIAKASANRSPDVVRMDVAWVPEFSQSGLLTPLNGFHDFESVVSLLQSSAGLVGYYEGFNYSLPVNINTKVAIYNRSLLTQAGLSSPPERFEEVIKLARKERYMIGLGGLDTWKTLPCIYALGGKMTDDQYKQATGYLNSKATVHAVEELVSLYQEQLIDRTVVNGGGDNWEGVKSGNILVTDEGPWFYSVFQGDELSRALNSTIAVPFPHEFGPSSIVGGEDLVIPKGAKQPEEAWEFMKFMTSKPSQEIMAQTGLIPTNREAKVKNAALGSIIRPYEEALNNSFLRPPVKAWSQIDEIYTSYMTRIFQGELSAEEGLTKAASEIDIVLER
ncbi:extracellular solute-binding protein [Paenibacillus cookii]|uniref:Sugar ABC transporter substrate-binding protein n=1 Tax=Paenibacillus cookii TaxID=157839 RepID=A0ABQ4LQX5_9BACL|nr:extracellular solute-binding protein [Paenibacillus cookii]KHF31616.1 Maltose/maltodextrin-binding protein precursor [Paenibacillus sp. P1XP2]GIO65661.1 sugar ABC transporter substrate-binding protein [Paenibacillus cookii]